MTVNAEKASELVSALATGLNSLAFISDVDALSKRLRLDAAARWKRQVLWAIVGLERSLELLEPSTPAADMDEARSLLSDVRLLLKSRRWDSIKISVASARCMKKLQGILVLHSR